MQPYPDGLAFISLGQGGKNHLTQRVLGTLVQIIYWQL